MSRVGVPAGREMIFDRGVSVQFARPITVRFIRELPLYPPPGLVWIEVYQIISWGDALSKRELLVRCDGLERAARFGLIRRDRPSGRPSAAAVTA